MYEKGASMLTTGQDQCQLKKEVRKARRQQLSGETPRAERAEAFMTGDAVTKDMVDAALKAHRAREPRLLESAYQACLAHEFQGLHALVLACLALLAFRSS
jgi:hypothetical protein